MTILKIKRTFLTLVLGVVALIAVACGGSDDGVISASCPGVPARGLNPESQGSRAYTMILRVNTEGQVKQFAADPLRSRIRNRDMFLINTEYKKMGSGDAEDLFQELKSSFPCNRVMSLNGLLKVSGKPGYMYALAGEQGLDAILLDWEKGTWEEANKTPWSDVPKVALKRMVKDVESVANQIAENPGAAETRVGTATEFRSGWDYADFADRLARVNSSLNKDFLGYQIVQSQNRCEGGGGSDSLAALAAGIRTQYREGRVSTDAGTSVKESLAHLGFEISFSTNPKPNSAMAVDRDSPSDAARCTAEVLKTGGSAFIYWATPAAVEAMLDTAPGKKLRQAN